jgi:hypothetical protein
MRFMSGKFSPSCGGALALCRLLKTKGRALLPAKLKGQNAIASH